MSAEVEPPDLVQQLHAAVLRATAFTYFGIGAITSLAFSLMPVGPSRFAWGLRVAIGVLLGLTGVAGIALRRRQPLPVARLLAMAPSVIIIVPAISLGLGVRAATLPSGVVLVVIAGLLISARSALIAAALLITTFLALLLAEFSGLLPGATTQTLPPPLAWFISLSATVVAVALLVWTYARTFRRAMEQLERARLHADAANEAKSRFLATMSHEIRTPLNGVLGMAQVLESGELSADQARECVRAILRSGKVLQVVLNDVLDLSRAESGKLPIHPEPTAAADVLEDTRSLFAELARTSGHTIHCEWVGQPRTFLVDGVRVRQMLSNLVNNALKFTPPSAVVVRARYDGERLRFEVADAGPGLTEEQRQHLFRPFQQLDDSSIRARGGSGLGLSIVKRLSEAMGGTAGVSTNAPTGSVFWFTVAAPVVAQQVEVEGESNDLDGNGRRVLVVEDNAINRRVAEMVLRRRHFEVQCATNGREALELLSRLTFDLVLMDCQMPEMDGFEATRELRRREAGQRHLPIIALTASAFPEDHAECLASGMDDLLIKPLDVRKLNEALRRWVGNDEERMTTPAS